ncbi:hypothetical protein ScPMuIL_008146 [Solemya velum]
MRWSQTLDKDEILKPEGDELSGEPLLAGGYLTRGANSARARRRQKDFDGMNEPLRRPVTPSHRRLQDSSRKSQPRYVHRTSFLGRNTRGLNPSLHPPSRADMVRLLLAAGVDPLHRMENSQTGKVRDQRSIDLAVRDLYVLHPDQEKRALTSTVKHLDLDHGFPELRTYHRYAPPVEVQCRPNLNTPSQDQGQAPLENLQVQGRVQWAANRLDIPVRHEVHATTWHKSPRYDTVFSRGRVPDQTGNDKNTWFPLRIISRNVEMLYE